MPRVVFGLKSEEDNLYRQILDGKYEFDVQSLSATTARGHARGHGRGRRMRLGRLWGRWFGRFSESIGKGF